MIEEYVRAQMHLPFYVRMLESPFDNLGLPVSFPLSLRVNTQLGTLEQVESEELAGVLRQAYGVGSVITGQMEAAGIGKHYAADFLEFVLTLLGDRSLAGQSVLEIGCGTGYFLGQLKSLGAEVLGIEPGYEGFRERQDGVTVIPEFFPCARVTGTFDLIVLYGVLEHVTDPIVFLGQVAEHLNSGGTLLVSVPNCGPAIAIGDLSILVHEHFHYFDQVGLQKLLMAAGFAPVALVSSTFGGALYAGARMNATTQVVRSAPVDLGLFLERAGRRCSKIAELLNHVRRLGIYVPARMMNYLYLLRRHDLAHQLVFIDDNPMCDGRFLPGIPVACRPLAKLEGEDLDGVLIASSSFRAGLEDKVRDALGVRVWHLADL